MTSDIFEQVTARIISALEAGTAPWRKPWTDRRPGDPLRSTGQPYQGINWVLLTLIAEERGYTSPHWFTFNQARALGACVRKGEKASPVVYVGTAREDRDDESADARSFTFMRGYHVFNAAQIDNLPAEYLPAPRALAPISQREAQAQAYLQQAPFIVTHNGGNRAFCNVAAVPPTVHLPARDAFSSMSDYVATLAHELIHATGPELGRAVENRFGSDDYAREELIAELGAAFICTRFQIQVTERNDHAAYMAHWLKILREDHRAIIKASSAAQKAVAYLDQCAGHATAQAA